MNLLTFFLQNNIQIILGIHIVGVVIGFGGAIVTDILFLKFIKDGKIVSYELNILATMSKIIWTGILLICISGLFILLSDIDRYTHSAKFLLKMFVVWVIVINGLFLNFVVTPKLPTINFRDVSHLGDKTKNIRKLVFVSGAISATSWWTVFILGMLRVSPASFLVLLSFYLLIVITAIIGSLVVNSLLSKGILKLPSL
ncbi:MAG TPA: hypothetical protein PKA38_01715 [Candidatus Levybacteria bacterium]|nr:hypothetical protein [Candidatus Levybacteria bacterium]